MSNRFELDSQDFKKWGTNLMRFSAPSLLAALLSLQTGSDWRIALGIFYATILNAIIDLLIKFTKDNNEIG